MVNNVTPDGIKTIAKQLIAHAATADDIIDVKIAVL